MKTKKAYIAVILAIITIMLFAVDAKAGPIVATDQSWNNFYLEMLCKHKLELVGGSSEFLGTFIAGNSYTLPPVPAQPGTGNVLEFKLTGQYGKEYFVTCNVDNVINVDDAIITVQWSFSWDQITYNDMGTEAPYVEWQEVLQNGSGCNSVCYFKVVATDIVTASDVPHGTEFTFDVQTTAEVIL